MIKRIIFDLDDTLIPWTKRYYLGLTKIAKKHGIKIKLKELAKIADSIDVYEKEYPNFKKDNVKEMVTKMSGIKLTDELLDILIDWVGTCVPKRKNKKLMETLEYLSSKYELVVLTNFFTIAQDVRLERFGIRKYFKEVYGADDHSKPNKEAYIMAANKTPLNECLFVGDNLVNDYEKPIELGMEAIWLTKQKTDKRSIKDINELRRLL